MINLELIQSAAKLIASSIVRTPLIESDWINDLTGGRIFFKAECLQRTGSFKIRGATHKILSLGESAKATGVVAYSSGNHAQGVAAAAKRLGIEATIVMPEQAPAMKIANTRALGGNVVLYDLETENREAIAAKISVETGAQVVPPYDDEAVIAGQGTVGLEILDQLAEKGISPDAVICPCGGGGLIAGLSTALKSTFKDLSIYAAEPENFDDTLRSLEKGERVENEKGHTSICDAIITPTPGKITFEINSKNLVGAFAVSEESVRQAVLLAYNRLKLVVEPGASVGLAALLSSQFDATGKNVVVVLSGGNMDLTNLINIHQTSQS